MSTAQSASNLRWPQILGQVLAYGLLIGFVGFFSSAPVYQHLDEGQSTIKLSIRHAGQLLGECRERTPEEMAGMPPNMRIASVCPRERSPVLLELDLDGQLVYSQVLAAAGIHRDGRASVYRRLTVPAGETRVSVRLKDHIEADKFHYQSSHTVNLQPAQILVIDFDEQAGEFEFL